MAADEARENGKREDEMKTDRPKGETSPCAGYRVESVYTCNSGGYSRWVGGGSQKEIWRLEAKVANSCPLVCPKRERWLDLLVPNGLAAVGPNSQREIFTKKGDRGVSAEGGKIKREEGGIRVGGGENTPLAVINEMVTGCSDEAAAITTSARGDRGVGGWRGEETTRGEPEEQANSSTEVLGMENNQDKEAGRKQRTKERPDHAWHSKIVRCRHQAQGMDMGMDMGSGVKHGRERDVRLPVPVPVVWMDGWYGWAILHAAQESTASSTPYATRGCKNKHHVT
ncbi:hypothetical protein B0T10DRAFT_455811 [Thelonectria olida]|uniref:Uncharacterized protein n=1 Tax=Thelonectria olida TaxID=1576542 RepID=A0A9P8WCC8_9HYPO|nr:hypothetical protein B0T10DRAFT_455811 [Thelonectria olida]